MLYKAVTSAPLALLILTVGSFLIDPIVVIELLNSKCKISASDKDPFVILYLSDFNSNPSYSFSISSIEIVISFGNTLIKLSLTSNS